MAEQQLVDYIKKAREAGQADGQISSLLIQNGWTDVEIKDAMSALSQPPAEPQAQPTAQPQIVDKPKVEEQPEPAITAQPETQVKIQVQSQPQTQPSATRAQTNMPRMKGKSHIILKLLMVLIIVVVLCGAGLYVGGQYVNLPYNPFWPSPITVISKMQTNMEGVKSSHVNMQFNVNALNNNVSQGKAMIKIDSKNDINDANNPKTDAKITFNLSATGSASADGDFNIITVDKSLYFKINSFNFIGPISIPNVSNLIGKWYKADENSISKLNELSQAQAGQAAMFSVATQADNADLTKKIQSLLSMKDIFTVEKQLPDEAISGQNTYHYSIKISKDKLKDLMNKILTLQSQNIPTDGSAVFIQAMMSSFVDSIGDINMEIWIGKKDYMLYQIKVDKTIDFNKIMPGANTKIEIKLNETNSDFNTPITVKAPTDAQRIEDIILPLIKNSSVSNDMTQIGFTALMLKTSPQGYNQLCKGHALNGLLADYGANLLQLNNDIVKQGAGKPGCFSAQNTFCVSTQLADGGFMCIDGSNIIGNTKCTSATTVCNSNE